MKKRSLSILFGLIMVIALIPATVFADTGYGLYVNGEPFTSEKLSIKCGDGTATYDPDTATLTLNDAAITKGGTNNNYGIIMTGNTNLNITLSGTNSINLQEGGGIIAEADVKITGSGKLSVTAGGESFDGISVEGNVRISDNADVEIKADKGVGIASDESVEIDGAKLDSKALYAGIDACGLSVTNNSDVVLQATQDRCNAAFIRKVSGETGGNIIISGSKLKAESKYPGLYSKGHMTIDGGEVKAVSTENSAIWAVGNLTVKGGAKLKLDGAYPSGCPDGSLFTVEAADIDAQNSNTENIPALFNNPEISRGYQLSFAKAVDSEGTEIDLLSSGTQYFKSYKNVHFITQEAVTTIEMPFVKTVKQGGSVAPGKQTFEFEIFDIGNGNTEGYKDVTVNAKVETGGAGDYKGKIMITGPASQVEEMICEGFYIREKNTGSAGWTYSDAVYHAVFHLTGTGSSFELFPVEKRSSENGDYYAPVQEAAVDSMVFVNTYTNNAAPDTSGQTGGSSNTGDNSDPALWAVLLAISMLTAAGIVLYGRKKRSE